MKKKNRFIYVFIGVFCLFILISFLVDFRPGKEIFTNFIKYSYGILMLLPFIFILIGLFEVWVKRETIEKHLGVNSGAIGFFWAIVLGGITIGPMIVALPLAYALAKKGARMSIIFAYIGSSAVCRIPMTIFEASYVGILFTCIRYVVSIPLIIVTSLLLGKYWEKGNYTFRNGNE